MSVLGKFGVIMADPPWEIHQDLPYGTMQDEEMRQMKIGDLQDDGVIFLWVTGLAFTILPSSSLRFQCWNPMTWILYRRTSSLRLLKDLPHTRLEDTEVENTV